MTVEVLRGFEHETIEAKARWFRGLTMEERLRAFDAFYQLATKLNPKLLEGADAATATASVRVLKLP